MYNGIDIDTALAYIQLDIFSTEDIIQLANNLHENGSCSSLIACLAKAEDLDYLEAKHQFLGFMHEMSLAFPQDYISKKIVLKDVLQRILNRKMFVVDALTLITTHLTDIDRWAKDDFLAYDFLAANEDRLKDAFDGTNPMDHKERNAFITKIEQQIISAAINYLSKSKK